MSSVSVHPFAGLFRAQSQPSSFAFGVRHSDVFWYRGSLPDVTATLRGDGEELELEGSARVDSITVVEPAAMRAIFSGRSSSTPSTIPRSRSAPPRCSYTARGESRARRADYARGLVHGQRRR